MLLPATYLGDVAGTYRKAMQNLRKCYAKGVGIVRRNLGKRTIPRSVMIPALKKVTQINPEALVGERGCQKY